MGTHCRAKPLTGLELNLSVHVVDVKISISWKRKKEKDAFQTVFLDSEANHMLTEGMRNELSELGEDCSSLRTHQTPERNPAPVFTGIQTAALHWQGLFPGEALAGRGRAMKGGGAGMPTCV